MDLKNISKSKELQIFLVQRFLMVIAFIYIMEQMINALYQNVFLTILVDVLEVGDVNNNLDSLMSVGGLLILVIIHYLSNYVPLFLQHIIASFAMSHFHIRLQTPSFIAQYGSGMTQLYYIAVILVILVQLIITLLPYFVAGWWYINVISGKMAELRRYDMEQKMEYDRRRNLLFSDIVHDVKTPITTVSGYSRALLDGLVTEPGKEREYLQAIHAKSMRISDLITMLFEFVKLDSEGFELHPQTYDLAELVRENVIMLFADFEDKGLELDIDIPDEACMVKIDRIQMSRVVTNLLTNTIRYLKEGDVVKVSLKVIRNMDPTIKGAEQYMVSVADNGIPIDSKLKDNIFDPFTRADSARNTVSGGSGLGLSIAHKIAALHGGELVLNQPCGGGFTKAFEIYVPALREDEEEVPE